MKQRPITKAEFSRKIGVSPPSVTKAIKDGRISVRADGLIDFESAKRQWRENTSPSRAKVNIDLPCGEPQERQGAAVVSETAVSRIKTLLTEQGVDASGPLTLQLARVAEVISRTEAREFALAVQRKEYVPLQAVEKHITRIISAIKQAFVAMPARCSPTLAGRLGVDPHVLQWGLREAVNDTLADLASPMPTLAESVGSDTSTTAAAEDEQQNEGDVDAKNSTLQTHASE